MIIGIPVIYQRVKILKELSLISAKPLEYYCYKYNLNTFIWKYNLRGYGHFFDTNENEIGLVFDDYDNTINLMYNNFDPVEVNSKLKKCFPKYTDDKFYIDEGIVTNIMFHHPDLGFNLLKFL